MKKKAYSMKGRLLAILVCMLFAMNVFASFPVEAAGDAIVILDETKTAQVTLASSGQRLVIQATDTLSMGGTSWANVTDNVNGDSINVTLHDDGNGTDDTANDGKYYGIFTITDDLNLSGSSTNDLTDVIDVAHGESIDVKVNLDGDASSGTATVISDFRAPSIVIHISSGSYYNQNLSLGVTVDDDNLNTSSIMWALDGANYSPFSSYLPGVPLFLEEDVNTSNVAEGIHFISVIAQDDAGNSNTMASVDFDVDHTPPEIVPLDLEGALISGTLYLQVSIKTDIGAPVSEGDVRYSMDSGPKIPFTMTGPGTFETTIDMKSLGDGEHNLELIVDDAAGNSAVSNYSFVVDATSPKITAHDPVFDAFYNLNIEVEIEDEHMDNRLISFYFNNDTYVTPSIVQNGTILHATIMIADGDLGFGLYTFRVEAEDDAGNLALYTLELTLIEHPAPCTACKIEYRPDGTVFLHWVGPAGPIDEFRIYSLSGPNEDIRTMTDYESTTGDNFTIPKVADLSPGIHYFAIVAVKDGVEGPPCIIFVDVPPFKFTDIDLKNPVANPSDPTEGDEIVISGNLTNGGTAHAIVTVELWIDGNKVEEKDVDLNADSEEPTDFTWVGTEGEHNIELKAYQKGNPSESITRSVRPKPLIVRKMRDATEGSWLDNLIKGTPLEPIVKPVRRATGGDLQCCIFGLVLLVVLIGILYAIIASRRSKRDVDRDLNKELLKERRSIQKDASRTKKAYPQKPSITSTMGAGTSGPALTSTTASASSGPVGHGPATAQTDTSVPQRTDTSISTGAPPPLVPPVPMPVAGSEPTPETVQPISGPKPPEAPITSQSASGQASGQASIPAPDQGPDISTDAEQTIPKDKTTTDAVPTKTVVATGAGAVSTQADVSRDRVSELRQRIEQIKARGQKASMESMTAVSKSRSASTKADADAAAGMLLLIKERLASAIKELDLLSAEAVSAGLSSEVDDARTSLTKTATKIQERIDKTLKAADERTA